MSTKIGGAQCVSFAYIVFERVGELLAKAGEAGKLGRWDVAEELGRIWTGRLL